METTCTLQLFIDGTWRDAALVTLTGDASRGTSAQTYLEYFVEYAVDHLGETGAAALSVCAPVDLQHHAQATWPPFLIDLLPQGYGREELLRQLNLAATAGASADWELLRAGAGNPIGNVRVKEAYQWVTDRSGTATHPDGIARRIRWQRDDGGSPDWGRAIDQAFEAARLDNRLVRAGIATMAAPLSTLFDDARALGIDRRFLAPLEKTWERVLRQVEAL